MFLEVTNNHRLAVEISSFAAQNDLSAKSFPRTITDCIGNFCQISLQFIAQFLKFIDSKNSFFRQGNRRELLHSSDAVLFRSDAIKSDSN